MYKITLEDNESALIKKEVKKIIPGPSQVLKRALIKAKNNKEFTKGEIKEFIESMEGIGWDYPILFELKQMLILITEQNPT